ncbi:hypothetical protein BDW02DRAFT_378621 [Decorospora gaudefroyi]|uniref:Uncharacterized protein n=1 Tax=Decorospora gaudefroyi TaxID=184978 RepID=A0A6A5KAG0_9PLEO|nr:hypothetical protein BDW02DRAFT_378621 [Decorospora gaudefroyi]
MSQLSQKRARTALYHATKPSQRDGAFYKHGQPLQVSAILCAIWTCENVPRAESLILDSQSHVSRLIHSLGQTRKRHRTRDHAHELVYFLNSARVAFGYAVDTVCVALSPRAWPSITFIRHHILRLPLAPRKRSYRATSVEPSKFKDRKKQRRSRLLFVEGVCDFPTVHERDFLSVAGTGTGKSRLVQARSPSISRSGGKPQLLLHSPTCSRRSSCSEKYGAAWGSARSTGQLDDSPSDDQDTRH